MYYMRAIAEEMNGEAYSTIKSSNKYLKDWHTVKTGDTPSTHKYNLWYLRRLAEAYDDSLTDDDLKENQCLQVILENIAPVSVDSVSLSASPSSITLVGSSTLSATVLDENDNPLKNKSVEFFDGQTSLGTETTNSSGVATKTFSSQTTGSHTITATCGSVTSSSVSVTVSKADSDLSISIQNSMAYHEPFTISGTLTDGTNAISGATISLEVDGTVAETDTNANDGTVSFTQTITTTGNHTYQLKYSGDATYNSDASDTLTRSGSKTASLLEVTSPTEPVEIQISESVTITGTLEVQATTGYIPLPNATINIKRSNVSIGTMTTNSNGVFTTTLTGSSLGGGISDLLIEYESNTFHIGSQDSVEIEVVAPSEYDSISITSNKDVLSYVDSESATITAQLVDSNDDPVALEDVQIDFYKDGVYWASDYTDSDGKVQKTYNSTGAGDVEFGATDGILLIQTYEVQDCSLYRETLSSSITDFTLPSKYKLEFDIPSTSNGTYASIGTDNTHRIITGQMSNQNPSLNGVWVYNGSSTATQNNCSTTPTQNAHYTFAYEDGAYTMSNGGSSITGTIPTGINMQKLLSSTYTANAVRNYKIKPL